MKLYATLTKANGKSEKITDNKDIVANFYKGNKLLYMVRVSYCNVGDIEEPKMDAIITSRDYRSEKGKSQKGENDDVCKICKSEKDGYESLCYDCQMKS